MHAFVSQCRVRSFVYSVIRGGEIEHILYNSNGFEEDWRLHTWVLVSVKSSHVALDKIYQSAA